MGNCCGAQHEMFENILQENREINQEERNLCKKIFDFYDIYQNGTVSIDDFESIVNQLGYNPSKKLLDCINKAVTVSSGGSIDFEKLMSFIPMLQNEKQLSQTKIYLKDSPIKKKNLQLSEEQIQKLQEHFQKVNNKGFIEINIEYLKKIMNEQGCNPTQIELLEIVEELQNVQIFDVNDFLKFLIDRMEMQHLA